MEPKHTKASFWTVKTVMLFLLACAVLYYGNICRNYGENEALKRYRGYQYQLTGQPYCWSGPEIYPIINFNLRTLVVRVKKEPK